MDIPSNNRLCHYYALCKAQNFGRAPQKYYELFHNHVSQPTITRSLMELEEEVNGLCIEREPFRRTAKGDAVFLVCERLVESFLPDWHALKRPDIPTVHVGAPEYAVRRYLLTMTQRILAKYGQHVQFHPCNEHEIVCGVMKSHIHLGVCAGNRPMPPQVLFRPLLDVEPVILLPATATYRNIKTAADLWRLGTIPFPLIFADETHSVRVVFDAGLATMKVRWPERRIAGSTALIPMMVATDGIPGLSFNLDQLAEYPGVRAIALPGFEPIRFGPVWCEPLSDLQKKLLAEIDLMARDVHLAPIQAALAAEQPRKQRAH